MVYGVAIDGGGGCVGGDDATATNAKGGGNYNNYNNSHTNHHNIHTRYGNGTMPSVVAISSPCRMVVERNGNSGRRNVLRVTMRGA